MAKPYGGTIRNDTPPPALPQEELLPLITARVNLGMITTIDAGDIDPSAGVDLLNMRVRYDKAQRRSGTVLLDPTAPDSDTIMFMYNFKRSIGDQFFLRVTAANIYSRNSTDWTQLTGTLTGDNTDRFGFVTAFDKCIFTNGVDPIQVIADDVLSYAQLGNAPVYRYITAFDDRIIGAYLIDTVDGNVPIQIGWSGNTNITEWDPNVDISAGSAPLQDSPGDLADFITGLVGFTSVLVVTRERSIWLGTKTGTATAPFNFYAAVPGIGCGCPASIAVVPGGICFADQRTQKVYVLTLDGSQPTAISTNIEIDLFSAISDPNQVFGSYDNRNNEYCIAVPQPGTMVVRVWIFNFRTQAWSYDERINVTALADVEAVGQELTIDDLVGTIDQLVGTIDGLVNDIGSSTSRLYGYSDGHIEIERASAVDDSGLVFTSRFTSKNFYLDLAGIFIPRATPPTSMYVTQLNYEVICNNSTSFRLYYSRDGGNTWVLLRTDAIDILKQPLINQSNKQVKATRYAFKIESDNGSWEIIEYELHVIKSGTSRADPK